MHLTMHTFHHLSTPHM